MFWFGHDENLGRRAEKMGRVVQGEERRRGARIIVVNCPVYG